MNNVNKLKKDTSDDTPTYRKEYLSVSFEMNVLGVKGPRQMSILVPGMDHKFNREDFIQNTANDTLSCAWKKIFTNLKPNSPVLSSPNAPSSGTDSSLSPTLTSSPTNLPSTNTNNKSSFASSTSSSSKLSSIRRSLFHLSRTQSVEKSRDDPLSKSANENTLTNGSNKRNSICRVDQQQQKLRNVVKLVNKSPEWHKGLNSFALDFHGRVTMASVKNFQVVHEVNPDYVVMQFGKVSKDLYTCDFSYPFCALQAFALALTSLDNKLGCD